MPAGTTGFRSRLIFADPPVPQTAIGVRALPGAVNPYAGLVAGAEWSSNWFVRRLDFVNASDLPVDGIGWTITESNPGTLSVAVNDTFPPRVVLTNAGADDDKQELQFTAGDAIGEFVNLNTGGAAPSQFSQSPRKHYFETMLRFRDTANTLAAATITDTAVEQNHWFVGWANTDTDILGVGAAAGGAADFIGFVNRDLNDDADQDIDFVCDNAGGAAEGLVGGVQTATGWTTLNPAATNSANSPAGQLVRRNAKILGSVDWIRLAFLVDADATAGTGGIGSAHFWINNVYEGSTIITTFVPDQAMCTTLAHKNGEADAKIMEVAYVLEAVEYGDI